MGSALESTFSNFCVAHLENKVSNIKQNKIYKLYVNIIFHVHRTNELHNLQLTFQNNSALNFTYELNTNKKPPFLDVLIDTNNNTFTIFLNKIYSY